MVTVLWLGASYLGNHKYLFLFVGKEAEIQRGEVLHFHAGGGAEIAILVSDPEPVAPSTELSYP